MSREEVRFLGEDDYCCLPIESIDAFVFGPYKKDDDDFYFDEERFSPSQSPDSVAPAINR